MKRTPGQSKTTASSRPNARQPSTPLKVALLVADCLEIAPRLMSPLEVRTGAHLTQECDVPKLPVAVIDVVNTEDGQEYQILVTRKPPTGTATPESRS